MKRIILASGSPRRRELLSQIGLEFTVITSEADEHTSIKEPARYVEYLSSVKAEAVHDMIQNVLTDKDNDIKLSGEWYNDIMAGSYVIIGADTIVSHKEHILTKPVSSGIYRCYITLW